MIYLTNYFSQINFYFISSKKYFPTIFSKFYVVAN